MPFNAPSKLATFMILCGTSVVLACDEGIAPEHTLCSHDCEEPAAADERLDDTDIPDDAPELEAEPEGEDLEADPVASLCTDHAACFSWCGARYRDGRCHSATHVEMQADRFGPVLCDPTIVEVVGSEARAVGDETRSAARCFLQVLRYGHEGVAELYWHDPEHGRSGHLVVQGQGRQAARLELTLEGLEPECGSSIAMSAPRAHIRDGLDPHFTSCLDSGVDLENELERCVLGPAHAFFDDYDVAFDIAFPWLSGSCFPG